MWGLNRRVRFFIIFSALAASYAMRAPAQQQQPQQPFGSLPDFNVLNPAKRNPNASDGRKAGSPPDIIIPDSLAPKAPPPAETQTAPAQPQPPQQPSAPVPPALAIPDVVPDASSPPPAEPQEKEEEPEEDWDAVPSENFKNTPADPNLPPAPDAIPKRKAEEQKAPAAAEEKKEKEAKQKARDAAEKYKYRPDHTPAYTKQYSVENLHLPEIQYESEYIRLFFDAVAADNIDAVRGLYNYFKTAEFRDNYMNTPLMYAVMIGRRRMVETLLGMGANPNSYNQYRVTPLMAAAKEKRHDFASLLLHYDAIPDLADRYGHTALMYAAAANSPETVMLLSKYGANMNATRFSDGSGALHLAVHYNSPEAAYMLLKYGSNPDAMNTHRITPLMLSANYNNSVIARLLLKFDANPALIDRQGRTAENFAWSRKNFNLAKMLSRYRIAGTRQDKLAPKRGKMLRQPLETQPQAPEYPPPPYYGDRPGEMRPEPIPPAPQDLRPPESQGYRRPSYPIEEREQPPRRSEPDYGAPQEEPQEAAPPPRQAAPPPEPQEKRVPGRKAPMLDIIPLPQLKPPHEEERAVETPPPAAPPSYAPPPYEPPATAPQKAPEGFRPRDLEPVPPPPTRIEPPREEPPVIRIPEPEPPQERAAPPPAPRSVQPPQAEAPKEAPQEVLDALDAIGKTPPESKAGRAPGPGEGPGDLSIVGEPQETEFSKQEIEEMQKILREIESQDAGSRRNDAGAPPPPPPSHEPPSDMRAPPPGRTPRQAPAAPPEGAQQEQLLENFYNSMKGQIEQE